MRNILDYYLSVVLGLQLIAAAPPMDESMQDFARKYKAASTENDRRTLCLDAIDRGLVRKGLAIETFDFLFGTNFAKDTPSRRGTSEKRVLHFAEQPASAGKGIANYFIGWYVVVEFDSSGSIIDYYLSNLHK